MSSQSPQPTPSEGPKRSTGALFYFAIGMAMVGIPVAGTLVWLQVRPKPAIVAKGDPIAAARANAQGIGYMDHFQFDRAVVSFEEAVKQAPDWIPGKINLGIALLNDGGVNPKSGTESIDRALTIFQEVIAKEPDNPYAHYCTGIIQRNRGKFAEALAAFEATTRIDPNDAHAWLYRGTCRADSSESRESFDCFEKALKLNPFLNAARYALAQHAVTAEDEVRKKKLLEEFNELLTAKAYDRAETVYSEMGRYAEVIGKSPAPAPGLGSMPLFEPAKNLKIALAPGTTWATADKLDELHRAVRARFGGTIILLDYNRDGKLDLLLLSSVVRNGSVGDLLLRNDGEKGYSDVTAEVGLANRTGSLGGAVADFDNDGFPDIALAGTSGMQLFRNKDGKSYDDATAAAGFAKEPGVYLTAAWADLDQDGDLDLIAAKYAQTPELALRLLRGEKLDGNGGLKAFVNVGIAPPSPQGQPMKPLSVAFKDAAEPEALLVKGPVTGFILTDLDGYLDLDIIAFIDGQPPVTVLNDRMFRFHRGDALLPSGSWNGGLVLDANGDDQSDFIALDASLHPFIAVSKRDDLGGELAKRFAPGESDSPPLMFASWVDLDLDGRTDLVGLSRDRKPIFLQGDAAGRFTRKAVPFGTEADSIPDLIAIVPIDFDDDGKPDVMCWSEGSGLRAFRNLGNGNSSLKVTLTGVRDPAHSHPLRTNADGIGSWVRLYAGPLRTGAENTTLSAGLGQSRLPLNFGIGKADLVDALRLRWPDAMPQAEVNVPAGRVTVVEENRKPDSCPTIFGWTGERYAFLTDCLGAGSMGEMEADGSTRPPRPEESVKLDCKLAPKNGKYSIVVGEPMDEIMYLDRLQLDVVDHPAGTTVLPDERFVTSGPQPSQERLFFRDAERIFPVKVIDQRGRDVTAILRERDGRTVDDFWQRSWMGFAEDHFVELDFKDRLPTLQMGQRLYLILAGWTDYPYPESIAAANQAGVPTGWPTLEQKQANGNWKNLGEIGLPAGLPRIMTAEVTGLLDPKAGPLRIRTNLQIYWDQIFLAPIATDLHAAVRELPVAHAGLEHRGFVQEFSPGGKLPVAYDYDRLEAVPYTKWRGKLTRTGDVTELLTKLDDHFAICGPGDEITAEFAADSLPPLLPGWERSFILRTWGYCKDTALATATSGQIGPLPYRAMSNYPYDPKKEPLPKSVVEYDAKWNTRPAGGR